jgi:hypothetical protein
MQKRDGMPTRSRETTKGKREQDRNYEGGGLEVDHPVLPNLRDELPSLDLPRELAGVLDGVLDSLVILRAESKDGGG